MSQPTIAWLASSTQRLVSTIEKPLCKRTLSIIRNFINLLNYIFERVTSLSTGKFDNYLKQLWIENFKKEFLKNVINEESLFGKIQMTSYYWLVADAFAFILNLNGINNVKS